MCVSPASDRGGQEVPTLFEESARLQPACMCVSPASDRGGQEVPTLFEESARQSVCMLSDRRRQEVPTLLEESARVQHSQLAGASSASDCEGYEV